MEVAMSKTDCPIEAALDAFKAVTDTAIQRCKSGPCVTCGYRAGCATLGDDAAIPAARAELARLRECVRLGDVLLEKTVAARDVLTSNSGDCLPMLHGHQADWERTIQAYRAARGRS